MAARRALLAIGSVLEAEACAVAEGSGVVQAGSPLAMLGGVDGLGRFDVLLAVPRFASLWELVILGVDVDEACATSAHHRPIADRRDIEELVRSTTDHGLLVARIGVGEASELVARSLAQLPEGRTGRDAAMVAAARVAGAVTRRSMLPAPVGESDDEIEEHPAFARVGLVLRGGPRAEMLTELETVLVRAGKSDDKLDELVVELARRLADRVDGPALRQQVAVRARHQAAVLRALGDGHAAGRAAFAAHRAPSTPAGQSPLAIRMIANGILEEIRRAADEPDEAAFRRALRERFFAGLDRAVLGDLETLDLLGVLAESLGEQGLELPEEAASAVRVVAEEVHEVIRASGPYRHLPVAGARAPAVAERTLVEVAERVLSRTLPRLPDPSIAEVASEMGAFVVAVCLSRCPHRCFEDPPDRPEDLFSADEHPSSIPRGAR